ncbi:MAG: putative intracellular septation protein [Devosia sp.]|jgi:intracellular septation protein|nr:putative intracellular septation protein [Devosia sp.]
MTEETKEDEVNWAELRPQLIRIGLEIGPLLIFFLCTTFGESWLDASPALRSMFASPIIFATAPFMVAMVISLGISWLVFKRVAVMPLVTLIVVLIFGTLTLLLQDSIFIKIKPTIVNSLFGATLLGGLVFGQSLLKYVFGEVYHLQPKGWQVMTMRWGLFFFLLAILNEVAWRGSGMFFTDPAAADKFYAGFKLWAVMPITIVFSMMQLPLLTKYAADPKQPIEVIPPMDPLP